MSGIVFRFPTNVSLDLVTQEYVIQRELMIGDQLLPFTEALTEKVQWDELDNDQGMTAPSNLRTDPKIDVRQGSKLREYTPMYFKETDVIREDELLRARAFGTLGGVIDISELVGRTLKSRQDKNWIRKETLTWAALQGSISFNENGVIVNETFPVQTFTAPINWDLPATAAPLKDHGTVRLKFRGTGARADGAVAYLNQTTLNALLANANQADIAGFRSENFRNTTFSLTDLNKIQAERKLPIYELYDEGFYDSTGTFQTFIPDWIVIVIGKRQIGQKVGDFVSTPSFHRTRNGMPAPGMFAILEVNGQGNPGMMEVSAAALGAGKNPRIDITGGFYGGPRILYPRSVVVMTVKT